MSERELGIVESVRLDRECGGALTMWVSFKFHGSGQGFGGFVLDQYDKAKGRRVGHAAGLDYILRVMDVFGVERLDDIEGKPAYALRASDKWGESIIGIEAPEYEGSKRFTIAEWREEWGLGEKVSP